MENGVVTQGTGQNISVYVEAHQKEAVVEALKGLKGVYINSAEPQMEETVKQHNDFDNDRVLGEPTGRVRIQATNTGDLPLQTIQDAVDASLKQLRDPAIYDR